LFALVSLALSVPDVAGRAASALAGDGAGGNPSQTAQSRTEILKWKDGKRAVFMLEFDDSCESHVKIVIPELKKRGLAGTFYINPGNGPFKHQIHAWEKEIPGMGMEYANHTFTHVGALSVAEWDRELAKCNEEIDKCFADRKRPRLISYGTPGVKKENWRISQAEIRQAVAKYHLIERPPFFGPVIHVPATAAAMSKVVDQAIARGEMGHLDFHGVGGDWIVTPKEAFVALLDKLDSCRDQLWITDPISWHKYVTERAGAEIKLLQYDERRIRILLSCKADPVFYDLPLTLSTGVPPQWKTCVVRQGKSETKAAVSQGAVRYAAMPGSEEITITP
jgi:peptidoglycan/xylan/chitin deacetylase (PgdA/CDA1 family)